MCFCTCDTVKNSLCTRLCDCRLLKYMNNCIFIYTVIRFLIIFIFQRWKVAWSNVHNKNYILLSFFSAGSRSTSPSSRGSYLTHTQPAGRDPRYSTGKRKSGIPRSQGASREASPNRNTGTFGELIFNFFYIHNNTIHYVKKGKWTCLPRCWLRSRYEASQMQLVCGLAWSRGLTHWLRLEC